MSVLQCEKKLVCAAAALALLILLVSLMVVHSDLVERSVVNTPLVIQAPPRQTPTSQAEKGWWDELPTPVDFDQ